MYFSSSTMQWLLRICLLLTFNCNWWAGIGTDTNGLFFPNVEKRKQTATKEDFDNILNSAQRTPPSKALLILEAGRTIYENESPLEVAVECAADLVHYHFLNRSGELSLILMCATAIFVMACDPVCGVVYYLFSMLWLSAFWVCICRS